MQYWVKRTEIAARSAGSFEDARRLRRLCKLDKTAKNAITKLAKGKWGRGSRVVTKMLNSKKAEPLSPPQFYGTSSHSLGRGLTHNLESP